MNCLSQLIDFVLTGMDKQMHTSMILVDLQKAFDTLDHGVLLEKMKYFVSGQTENFLFVLM